MWPVVIGLVVILLIGMVLTSKGSESEEDRPTVALHPEQLKFMDDMEQEYCSSNTRGKGIRCIIDYMREANSEEHVTEILATTPQYTEGFVPLEMDLHGRQIDWLALRGVKLGEGSDRYDDLSKAFRSMLSWAMQKADNKKEIEDIFGKFRCLNC